jgi:hypothetical protein
MGILQLKSLLHDVPGIDGLTMQTLVDRDTYSIAGKVVRVPIGANEAQVEQAIRAAVLSPAAAPMPAGVPLAPESPDAGAGVHSPTAPATNSAALIPSVDLPTKPKANSSMSVTGAAHVGTSLKDMLTQRKAKIAAAHDKLNANFDKLDQATSALDTLGDKVGSEADDLLATVGQISNEIVGGA